MKAPKGSPLAKAVKKQVTGGIIATIIGVILFLITSETLTTSETLPESGVESFYGILFIIGVILLICGIVSIFSRKKLYRKYCKVCGEKFDFDIDVDWRVLNTNVTGNSTSAQKKATVEFLCECSNCGHTENFTEKFTVASINSRDEITENNLETLMEKYFN